MFFIPEHYRRANLISFDPGIHTTGTACVTFDTSNGTLLSITAKTFKTDRLNFYTGFEQEALGLRSVLLERLSLAAHNEFMIYRPWAIGCESPFYNPGMPGAYGSLTEVVSTLQTTANRYNPNIPFDLLSPQNVKKAIGVAGKKGKGVVREALAALPNVCNVLTEPLSSLDEHSLDAIAVAIAMFKFRLFC